MPASDGASRHVSCGCLIWFNSNVAGRIQRSRWADLERAVTAREKGLMAMTIAAGDTLPDITLATLDGQPQRLADLLGERTLFFFWGSW